MELILTLAIIGIMVAIAVKMANTRGRDATTWGILTALFGVFALIALAIMGQAKVEE